MNATTPQAPLDVQVLWWNVQGCFHYVAKNKKMARWPNSAAAYAEKITRIADALDVHFKQQARMPDLVGLGEISNRAANDLAKRIFPGWRVISLDAAPGTPSLQIAVFVSPSISAIATESPPLSVQGVPDSTRPMAVINLTHLGNTTRVYFCHWTARLDNDSDVIRSRIAVELSNDVFDFIGSDETRHVVIVGDLNEEPFDENMRQMYAHRHRARATAGRHYTDAASRRINVYNASWRLLGERHPHSPKSGQIDVAGTYFWAKKRTWHTLDQVLVSGGLLGASRPFLDESSVSIIVNQKLVNGNVPEQFEFGSGKAGVSDHLPIQLTIGI